MGHIFISYSHKDTKYAHGLAANLQGMGFDIWIDERLDYGSQWPHEIQRQLDTCDAFILIMSPRSFDSEWVQSELQRAKRKLKPIFPLLLEGDEPWLSVESTQYYDVRDNGLPDARFYSALKRVISVSQSAQTFSRRQNPPVKTEKQKNMQIGVVGWVILALGGLGAVSLACLIIMVPLLSRFLNLVPPPAATAVVITATSFEISATETSISDTSTSGPTQTSEPTWTPSPLPTATWTRIPPTFTRVPPTVTPEPIIVTKNYSISNCCNSSGQRSSAIDYSVTVNTLGTLKLEFTPDMPSSCSDIYLHILWDGEEIRQTGQLGPISGIASTGLLNLSSSISGGKHTLTISPEGILGGCNGGILGGWAGTLKVQTSKNP